jgi:NADP-dependent 3-hydroxy acid dehydrogenase YdfG
MRSEDVAEVVVFALTRPPSLRILETAFRSMQEGSWG